jgi:hypothetical protein
MIAHANDRGVLFLETCTAEVSRPTASHNDFSRCEAVRKDSAVHVSLSSDSVVKQPGDRDPLTLRRTEGPPKPMTFRLSSEVWSHPLVRSFAGAPSRRRRAALRCGRYIGFGFLPCQHLRRHISTQRSKYSHRSNFWRNRSMLAALRGGRMRGKPRCTWPHLGHIPPSLFRVGERPVVVTRIKRIR